MKQLFHFFITNNEDIEHKVHHKNKYPLLYILCDPNEKHNKEEETTFQLLSYLENDDVDLLISFLSQHPKIDIHKNIELTFYSYYFHIFDNSYFSCSIFTILNVIQMIDFCCLFSQMF